MTNYEQVQQTNAAEGGTAKLSAFKGKIYLKVNWNRLVVLFRDINIQLN